jgi:hypothetical protein
MNPIHTIPSCLSKIALLNGGSRVWNCVLHNCLRSPVINFVFVNNSLRYRYLPLHLLLRPRGENPLYVYNLIYKFLYVLKVTGVAQSE